MNRTIVSIGIAAAVICGSATPALAADNPINAKITYISSVTTPAPQSGTSTPSTRPAKTAEASKPSETKLAKTGTNAEIAATLVIMIAAIGAVVYIISDSRKENN